MVNQLVNNINTQLVILASRSPRRVELLKQLGVDSMVMPADIDESVMVGEAPADYVKRVARQKVMAIAKHLKSEYANFPVLAADTTVALGAEFWENHKMMQTHLICSKSYQAANMRCTRQWQ